MFNHFPSAWQPLVHAALIAREKAHAPYSQFQVGAALHTDEGHIISGCNIESASYGLTLCAERVALFKALPEGERRFRRLAVVAETPQLTPPCGACRQLLWEYAPHLEILLGNLAGQFASYKIQDLLPLAFDAQSLVLAKKNPPE